MKIYNSIKEYDEAMKLESEKAGGFKKINFICPKCKTPQSYNDFKKEGIDSGVIMKVLAFSCIGRHSRSKGCNWSLGGWFQIHEVEVREGGVVYKRFDTEV